MTRTHTSPKTGLTVEEVTTDQLRDGDLVLNYGMRIRLSEHGFRECDNRPGGPVHWFTGIVENYDEIRADENHITRGLLRSDREWTVQGNSLAYWHRIVES